MLDSTVATAVSAMPTSAVAADPIAATNIGQKASAAATASRLSPASTAQNLQVGAAKIGALPNIPIEVFHLAATALIQLVANVALTAVSFNAPSPIRTTPTLSLNGYDLVPASTEKITSFYGQWTYGPGTPGMIQGQQQFDVVDPNNRQKVGTFDALVGSSSALHYTVLLVTASDGPNVGTAAGEVPPVGSIISTLKVGPIVLSYSDLTSVSGNVVSAKLLTPFGKIKLPVKFDAAKGIADHTADNAPVDLGNGYKIAPADPNGETLTAMTGILPLFKAVQGYQTFNVYDSNDKVVGSFDGVFTTTADLTGIHTQAILVTKTKSGTVGTAAGDVPPVGSVYNVLYRSAEDNQNSVLYSSLPSPSGNVISVKRIGPDGVKISGVTLVDASRPAFTQPLAGPGGRTFVPVSAMQPSGVNGLPPREVEIQGYQQFDVYDSTGNKIGSFDADVETQWDLFGIKSEAILVTKPTTGTVGTGAGDVPPAGSIYEYVHLGNSRIGFAKFVAPSTMGDVTSFKLMTPLGDIPLHKAQHKTGGSGTVEFYDPF